jgi:ferredoxin--NADP+ reductase
MFPIVAARRLAPSIMEFKIEAPLIARKRKPGNFIMVRIDTSGERIPLTVADSDEKTITVIVQAVGKTTHALCALKAGDSIRDVVGPLGTPTPIRQYGDVACIGGGVGTAELYPIARSLAEAGNRVHTIIGGRTRELVILEEEMRRHSTTLRVTTDDGSYGTRGLVTDALREILQSDIRLGAVYAIGPMPMMKAVAELTREPGIHTVVSLNTIMVDGTGMCGGCRVTVGGQMKFACVDGPEFDAHEVDFDELIMRSRTYAAQEREAYDRHLCRLAAETGEAVR